MISTCDEARLIVGATVSFSGVGGTGIGSGSHEAAEKLMMQVHEQGSSTVGIYTYDIAVSRTNLAIQAARKNGYPLRVEIE